MRDELGTDLPAAGVENGAGNDVGCDHRFPAAEGRLALIAPGDVLVVNLRDQRVDEPFGIRRPKDAQIVLAPMHP